MLLKAGALGENFPTYNSISSSVRYGVPMSHRMGLFSNTVPPCGQQDKPSLIYVNLDSK